MTTAVPLVMSRHAGRWTWLALAAAAVIGTVLWALLSDDGLRAGVCFLGGLVLAVGAFEFGVFNIKIADRYVPHLTLAAAMFSYLMTALFLALVLAASSPDVIDGAAVAAGLFTGLGIWTVGLIARTWVRPERQDGPVNIVLHDELPTNTT